MMELANPFQWIGFYTAFATRLLEFKGDRQILIQKIQNTYSRIGMKLPQLEKDNALKDIDPFTVFGLFNKGISDNNRKMIIGGLISEFSISAEVPDNFSGIPVLNNMRAAFYAFEGMRQEHDMDNLWELFAAAIALAENDTLENREAFSLFYDRALTQFAVRWNITMGLYWIRPYTYLNLDSRNRWYIGHQANMPANVVTDISALKEVPPAKEYLELRDKCVAAFAMDEYACKSFPELSYHAWVSSGEGSQGAMAELKSGRSNAEFLRWFRPIIQALRDLGGSATPANTRKKIIENEGLTEEELKKMRGKSNVNKFVNNVDFAKLYLVKGGYMDGNIKRVWTLTEAGRKVDMTDELASEIFKKGVAENRAKNEAKENALGDADVHTVHYWLYAPGKGAAMWDDFYTRAIMAIGWCELGDLNTYVNKEEIDEKLQELHKSNSNYKNSAHAVWQFVHEMQPGDVVFAKRGRTEILGRGIVESDYQFDENYEGEYPNIRKVRWTHKGSWQNDGMFAMKTLTDISNYTDLVTKIAGLFEDETAEDEEDGKAVNYPPYTMEDFLNEVYISEESYHELVELLRDKKNIILQGAPGVGKTYLAKRLAYSIMEVKDIERVMMVQFHQSYSYEDFIMGIRPSGTEYLLRKGTFYKFCKRAEVDSGNPYFFIIDEINRGNLSKIFGELLMLIESDKRGDKNKLQLLYSDEMFYIPENVHIIGMMNTADRSLAMMDYALRRRFAFFDLKPGFSSDGFRAYKAGLDHRKFDRLIQCVENLNERITADESLGEGFCIGHSYFCGLTADKVDDARLSRIVEYELIPLLKEYWFDEPLRVKEWSENLRGAIK